MGLDWGLVAEIVGRVYDVYRSKGAPFNSEPFLEAFCGAVQSVTDVTHSIEKLSAEELVQGATACLGFMAAVVKAYHRKKNVCINANYYIPQPPTEALLDQARFCQKDRRVDSFECFLVLQMWAHNSGVNPQGVVLPVDSPNGGHGEPVLFGAPNAFVNDRDYLVGDTGRDELYKHTGEIERMAIREDILKYFEKHPEIRSFISVPIRPPRSMVQLGSPMAVVCVQSDKRNLLGLFDGNRRKLRLVLAPLFHGLAYFIYRLHYETGTSQLLPADLLAKATASAARVV